eukprot:g5406.t1
MTLEPHCAVAIQTTRWAVSCVNKIWQIRWFDAKYEMVLYISFLSQYGVQDLLDSNVDVIKAENIPVNYFMHDAHELSFFASKL